MRIFDSFQKDESEKLRYIKEAIMVIVNIHEAKTHFSKLIQQVVNGEEIIVAKSGVPLIKMIPYEKSSTSRKGGQLKGMMLVKDNFDEPLPREYLKSFYGEEPS